jgi:diguanylate cyclase (GGDEF)-like protein
VKILKQMLQRLSLKPGVKSYWFHLVYFAAILYFCIRPFELPGNKLLTILCEMVFCILLIAVRYLKLPAIWKYLFTMASLLFYMFLWCCHKSHFEDYNKIAFFLLPFYAYLLPDLISSNLAGFIVAAQYLSYSAEKPANQITGSILGIIITSISFSIVYHLLRKLTIERNRYQKLSTIDSLTGLANLGYTLEAGQKLIDEGAGLTVLITDLDLFKQINDTYGHIAGNKVLIEIARLLEQETAHLNRLVGRLGGDEFVILIKDLPPNDIVTVSERLTTAMERKLFCVDPDMEPIRISFSIGAAYTPPESFQLIDKLLTVADIDMYYNKFENHRQNVYSRIELPLLSEQSINLLRTLAEKDMYTYVHSEYTSHYASTFAVELGLPGETVEALFVAGWLHDIGKLLISNDIIRKSGSLTSHEYPLVQCHVDYGVSILKHMNLSPTTLLAVEYHHERWDGTGYPLGIAGEKIPLEGRILQLADALSAMSIKRVYRKTLTFDQMIKEIRFNSGSQFDPELAEKFIHFLQKGTFHFPPLSTKAASTRDSLEF